VTSTITHAAKRHHPEKGTIQKSFISTSKTLPKFAAQQQLIKA
jgi:hypothetical protein